MMPEEAHASEFPAGFWVRLTVRTLKWYGMVAHEAEMEPSADPRHAANSIPAPKLSAIARPAHMDKTYYGRRNADGSCDVWVVEDHTKLFAAAAVNDLATRDLPMRLDLHNHSPTGFEWGYGGSGPAQLALALLADALGDDKLAQTYYQDFKHEVVAGLGASWQISAHEIQQFVAQRRSTQYNASAAPKDATVAFNTKIAIAAKPCQTWTRP